MVRAMCGAKPMEKKRTEDLMEMLGLKEMVPLRWYGHVLRRDDGHVLKKASEGQDEARMTREAVEDTSGKGEQGCWFGEGGCLESSKMERLLLGWGKSATLFMGINPDQNWMMKLNFDNLESILILKLNSP